MGFHSSKMPRFALLGLGGVFLALIAILPGDFKLALVFHDGATQAVLSEEAYGKHQNHTKNSALPLSDNLKTQESRSSSVARRSHITALR